MNHDTEVLTDLIANARAGEFDDAELGAWVRCYIKAIEAATRRPHIERTDA